MKRVLIIGKHAMTEDIIAQYRAMDRQVDFYEACSSCEVMDVNVYDELFLLPIVEDIKADEENVLMLYRVASGYNPSLHEGQRILCHWCITDGKLLDLLKEVDLPTEINEKIEVYPFTVNEMWAQNILCGLNKRNGWKYRPLDADGIGSDDERTVHLVIVGFSEMGSSLALQAALTAHYPNFVRNHKLRTRITIISPEMNSLYPVFIERYKHLFVNSYYRVIDVKSHHPKVNVNVPMYANQRADFVDVEWEFVQGEKNDTAVRYKMEKWAASERQILTIALCGDEKSNVSLAYSLPDEIYRHKVPIWVHAKNDVIIRMVNHSDKYSSLCPFGMSNVGYDVRMPLVQMAKLLNYYYSCSYGDKGFPTELPDDEVQREWNKLNGFTMRHSNIYNVMTIPSKMRSLGYEQYDWRTYIALKKEEIETLAAVEHYRWNVERLILGFKPCNDAQRTEIAANINEILTAQKNGTSISIEDLKKKYKKAKIHYDICAFEELKMDATGKNVRIYDYDLTACLPLIVNSFKESNSLNE